jgi:hypothetical protein
MSLQQKITLKENSVRQEIQRLTSELNKLSTHNKSNPNDWRYLTSLSTAEIELKRLNEQLAEISR